VTPAWWTGLAPLEEPIYCGDARHLIRWADGELVTLDHDDPEGERLLSALGGEPSPCIAILEDWQRHRADLDVLLLTSRGLGDLLHLPGIPAPGGPGGWTATASYVPLKGPAGSGGGRHFYYGGGPGQGGQPPEDPLLRLLRLPGELPGRLVATVLAAWVARAAGDDPRVDEALPALHAALFGRALAAVRGWLGGGHQFDVRLADAPALVRRADGVIALELPLRWLSDVWARGLSTLAGRFCLSVRPDPAGGWTFTSVGPDLGEPQELGLRFG
jgi:hypothetical protein